MFAVKMNSKIYNNNDDMKCNTTQMLSYNLQSNMIISESKTKLKDMNTK